MSILIASHLSTQIEEIDSSAMLSIKTHNL